MELNSTRPVFRLEAGLPRSDNMKYDGKRKVRMLNEILAKLGNYLLELDETLRKY